MRTIPYTAAMVAAAGVMLATSAIVRAEDYPARPIHLIVGFSAGSSGDVVSRVIAAPMSADLGQQVVAESRPGAGGNVAAQAIARSPADGYALLNGSSTNITNAVLQDVPFDLAPIGS